MYIHVYIIYICNRRCLVLAVDFRSQTPKPFDFFHLRSEAGRPHNSRMKKIEAGQARCGRLGPRADRPGAPPLILLRLAASSSLLRSCIVKGFLFLGNAIYHTACSVLVILTNSCSKLQCQIFLNLKAFSYEIKASTLTRKCWTSRQAWHAAMCRVKMAHIRLSRPDSGLDYICTYLCIYIYVYIYVCRYIYI